MTGATVSLDPILQRAAEPHTFDPLSPPPLPTACDDLLLDAASYRVLLDRVTAAGVSPAVQIGLIIDAAAYADNLLGESGGDPPAAHVHAAHLWARLAGDVLRESEGARTSNDLKEWVDALHTVHYHNLSARATHLAKQLVWNDEPLALACLKTARAAEDSAVLIGKYGWEAN